MRPFWIVLALACFFLALGLTVSTAEATGPCSRGQCLTYSSTVLPSGVLAIPPVPVGAPSQPFASVSTGTAKATVALQAPADRVRRFVQRRPLRGFFGFIQDRRNTD